MVYRSSWGTAAISMTRCLRVRPGMYSVSVALGANLGGPAYVREYTIRIDQYSREPTGHTAQSYGDVVGLQVLRYDSGACRTAGQPTRLVPAHPSTGPTMLARSIRERDT